MTVYKITHTPFTTGEPEDLKTDMDLDEAKAWLVARARRLEKKFPGAEINWDQGDMGFELTDDTAFMVGDYQGRTQIVPEHEDDDGMDDPLDDDRDQDNPVESMSYDDHDWNSDPDWGP